MTKEEKLKELILSRYESIREFTIQADIPYSTLSTMLSRGIDKATISNVLKVCKALNISSDALAEGEIVDNVPAGTDKNTDIINILANTKRQLLTNKKLMFNGKPADEEAIQSILDAMEVGMKIAKRKTEKK